MKQPTFEQYGRFVEQIEKLDAVVRGIQELFKETTLDLHRDIQENNRITDASLEELNLKVAFLMSIVAVKRATSPITGADGTQPFEKVSAMEMYLKGGRQMLINQRDASLAAMRKAQGDAQGLPTETPAPAADDAATAPETPTDDAPDPPAVPPRKPVTH